MRIELKSAPAISAFGVLLVAGVGLLGYIPGFGLLGSIRADYIPMAPSTAISFLVIGGVLLRLRLGRLSGTKPIALLTAVGLIALFGALKSAEYFTGVDLTFESAIMPDIGVLGGFPIGLMSPATGAGFFLAGIVTFLEVARVVWPEKNRLARRVSAGLSIVILLIALLFCFSYLYGTPLLYGQSAVVPMALTTAIGFLFLAVSTLFGDGQASPLNRLMGESTSSVLLRFILPLSIISTILGSATHVLSMHEAANPAFLAAAVTVVVALFAAVVAVVLAEHLGANIDNAKSALRKSEAMLAETGKTAKVGGWEVDFTGAETTLFWSAETFRIHELSSPYPPDLAVAINFYHADDRSMVNAALQRTIDTGSSFEFEARLVTARGNLKWVWAHGEAVTQSGEVVGIRGAVQDITDRKGVEEALRRSEAAVGKKLSAIVEPEGDIGTLELADIIDTKMVQSLMEDFYDLTGLLGAILDTSGNVLVAVGWQDICTKFHRCHPDASRNCIESDTLLTTGVLPGETKGYRCKNNMWDVVTPLVIGGEHRGNVFIGQFFYDDEEVDIELFREQARRYGFDEKEYLAALDRVPRFSREEAEAGVQFYAKIAEILSKQSFITIQQSRLLAERERSEEALRRSEAQFRSVMEAAPNAMYLCRLDSDGRLIFTSANPSFDRILGVSHQDFLGRALEEVFPNLVNTDIPEMYKEVALGNIDSQTFEAPYSDASIDGYFSVTVFRTSDRTIVIDFIDISERKRAEAELRDKERVEREILNNMVDAVITIDDAGKIASFNNAAERVFGYSFDDALGLNVGVIVPELEVSRHDGNIEDHLGLGDAHAGGSTRTVTGRHKDNHTIPMRLSVAELPFIDGASSGRRFIVSCHDLSESRKQEDIVRRAQKMDALGKLTGGIAHDFNNLLGVVTGYSEMLEEMLLDQPELLDYAQEIHHAGQRGAKLTRKLLSYSRQESAEEIKVDVNNLLRMQEDMLQKTLTVQVQVRLDLVDNVWPVFLDKNDLEDAIVNIAINAKHALEQADPNGRLTIRTRNHTLGNIDATAIGLTAGDYVQVSFSDTGCGMDETTKEKLFDPFFTTKGDQGTGLGLSQVFAFVQRTRGAIRVYTEIGQGSSFVLYFPRFLENEGADVEKLQSDGREFRGSETILVVDDEAALRDLASQLLSQQGYHVFCAENGKQALEILEREHIHLMLSDVIMPGIDGFQLAAAALKKDPGLKIQLASGFSDTWHAEAVDEALHMKMLHKPYESRVLFENVRDLLDN